MMRALLTSLKWIRYTNTCAYTPPLQVNNVVHSDTQRN